MARYNSVNTTSSVAGGNTITTPASGLLTTLTGSGTVTVPNPVLYTGQTQSFYNSTGGAITLSTPSGVFTGPGLGGGNTLSLPAGSIITLVSDGTNYIGQSWIGGAVTVGGTLTANGAVAMNPTGLNVSIQPTGAGVLTLSSGTTGSLDNVVIGGTTAKAGTFTTLSSNGATSFTANTAITLGTAASGAVQLGGGMGVAGGITVTGNSYFGGNVGLGVTNPLAKLHLGLTGQANAATASVSNLTAFATSARAGFDGLANNNDGIFFGTGINGGITAGLGFFREASGWNSAISFYTNNVTDGINVTTMQEKMRLNSAGYLGIGTPGPTTSLTIKKAIDSSSYGSGTRMIDFQSYFPGYDVDTIKASIYAGVSGRNTLNTQGGYLAFYTSNDGTLAERVRIDKDGAVGIGTTDFSAGYYFNVAKTFRANGMMLGNNDGSNSADNRIALNWSSGSEAYIYAQQNVPFKLGSNNAVQLYMAPNYVQVPTSTYFQLGAEAQAQSRTSDSSGGSGPYEMFRVSSTYLCTNGFFAISATRGSFVHCSTWAWSSSHNGTGQGTITQLSSTTYTNITVYLDVDTSGDCIVSADWGSSQNYSLYVQKMTGSTLSFANAGTAWSSPSSGYTRYSRSTISSGFHANNGSFDGSLSKGSGSFKIDHPLPQLSETNFLVHSFIEGPNADLIYRGEVALVNGQATVDIDQHSRMTEGTFVALCRKVQCFTTNETDWTPVRGKVVGSILTIEAQDPASTATVSWMVIGERKDPHMYETDWTDDNGEVIVEPLKNPVNTDFPPYPEHVNTTGNTDGTI
jgi:hypothetical protein